MPHTVVHVVNPSIPCIGVIQATLVNIAIATCPIDEAPTTACTTSGTQAAGSSGMCLCVRVLFMYERHGYKNSCTFVLQWCYRDMMQQVLALDDKSLNSVTHGTNH